MRRPAITAGWASPRAARVPERGLVLIAGLAAALPIIVATIYAVTDRWVPLGDDAYIAMRSLDVFSGRSPLVGQWSSGASGMLDESAYSPGPMLFWLLAIPVQLSASSRSSQAHRERDVAARDRALRREPGRDDGRGMRARPA